MNVLSLFAGIGGIDLGLERAGMTTVAQVELDTAARGVLADHWPDTTRFTDVREVTANDCVAAGLVPGHGVIAGGFPCQDLSVAGRRAGLGGARSGLFWEIVRLADALRPQWLVLENVPGLLSSNDGRDMGAVVGTLGDLGYGYAWRVLDAQFFGVPQRRRRVFIVGHLGDPAGPVRILLEPESSSGDPAPSRAQGARVAGALAAVSPGGGWRVGADEAAAGQLIPFDAAQITSRENRVNPQPGDPSMPLAATGSPHVAYAIEPETGQGADLRARQVEIAPAITATDLGSSTDRGLRLATTTAVRRLTPRECERLQGFPDDWTLTSNGKPQKDSPRYRQLGNTVAVPVLEWIGHRLTSVEREQVES